MTYYLLQSAAMFLVAYFLGCFCGCLLKSLVTTAPDHRAERDLVPVTAAAVAPAAAVVTATPRSSVPLPPAPPLRPAMPTRPASMTPAAPAAPAVTARPAQQPRPGVSAEVTAAAAAAAAATLATAAVRASVVPAAATAPAIAGDDLKRIKGIGPEIERKLNAIGVRRYSEIASWSSADVARINREIGQDGRAQHENWIEQAQILSRGGETAFSRRVDRREVNTGMVDTWTPTAPNEVARQAAAGSAQTTAPVSVSLPLQQPALPAKPAAVASPPASSPVQGPVSAPAAAAAAAIAAATVAANRPVITSAASAAQPPAPVQAAPVRTATTAAPPVLPAAPPSVAPAAQPISMRPAPGPGNLRRFVRLAAPEGKPDDLALISGVGDKTAGELNRYGVYHYWQLAAMGPDDTDYMETRLGHKGRMRREEWPEQARELMAGKPPRARSDRDRALHGQPEHGPGTAHAHPHTHKPAEPVSPAGAPVSQSVSTAPPAVSQSTAAPVSDQVLPPAKPAHVTAHHHSVKPVQPSDLAGDTSLQTPHGAGHHHAAGVGAAAAAVAAAAGQVQAFPAAPPVQAAPAQPALAAETAATDTAGTSWTPRSRPGNVAARTRDDLKRIKGVGVVIEKKLEAMGITSYAQIAAWGTADIDKVSNALDFKGRIEREQWVEQARILDGGGQTDFSRRMDRGDVSGTKI